MNWLLEPFELINAKRALLAALIIGFSNGFVSAFVVLRKSSLKVGSLSHSILPGIAAAALIAGLSPVSAFLGALFAALIVGLGSLWVSSSSRLDHDSALAVFFTVAFSFGVVLLTHLGLSNELSHWLFGDIRGMSDFDLWMVFGIGVVSLLTLTLLHRPLVIMLFEPDVAQSVGIPVRRLSYLMFGLLIMVLISSLQAVGCIQALGLLVAPAATVYLVCDSTRILFWGSAILGALGASAALVISYWSDLPTGPTIVLVLGGLFLVTYVFSPKYGLIRWFRRSHHEHKQAQ